MEFAEIIGRAKDIRERYDVLNRKQGYKDWNVSTLTEGFVGDVGKLMKLVMAKQGFRPMENIDEQLKHELADCLYSVIVIADKLGIDLEGAFVNTMEEIKGRIAGEESK